MYEYVEAKRLTLRQKIMKRKGRHCEATLLCVRRPAGSVVVIPEDDDGNELGKLAIWVCKVHKHRALDAARVWVKKFEAEHRSRAIAKEAKGV